MAGIKARLHRSQVVFTDLETAISSPRAGKPTRDTNVLHVADPAVIDCLTGLGVNLFATSNNHAWDLGSGGILAALDALDQRRLAHAGSGANLDGYSVEAGVRSAMTPHLEGYALAGYEDGDEYDGDFYGRLGAQVKFNQNWGINGDVKFADGDTQWFVGPRFSW